MQHTTQLSKTEENIYYIIDTLRCYSEVGFIASLYVRNYNELKIQMRLSEVRQCLSMAHLEYLNLVDYSLRFNELWATKDNKRYSTANRMFNMLKSSMESLKKEFRKSCPISHGRLPNPEQKLSVFEKSVLARGGCARDLFGIESYQDTVQALFYEQRALFTNVLASLLICRDVINKEKQTRADQARCIDLLQRQCDEIIADMESSIKYTQAPVTCEIQKLIEELGLGNAAQQGFHNYGLEDLTAYALFRKANSEQSHTISLDISNCYQKAEDIRILFRYFDDFRAEPTRKKPTSLKVFFVINWMGGTFGSPYQRCYEMLEHNYKGTLPTWHTVSTGKNDISRAQQEQFNKDLDAFIAEKKEQICKRDIV